jgi:hypothetical protein
VSLHKGEEGEGEDAALAREPAPLAGDREVLAGEPSRPKEGGPPVSAWGGLDVPIAPTTLSVLIDSLLLPQPILRASGESSAVSAPTSASPAVSSGGA